MKLAIIGYGALGRQLEQFFCELYGKPTQTHYFDDIQCRSENNNSVSPFNAYSEETFADFEFLIGLGYKHLDKKIAILQNLLKLGRRLVNLIAPSCLISPSSQIGQGVVIFPGCNICMNTVIGNGCFLYNGCIISHDTVLHDGTFLAPGVIIAGRTEIGSACFIGAGSVLANDLKIEPGCVLGLGTVLTRSLTAGTHAIGNPMHIVNGKLNL